MREAHLASESFSDPALTARVLYLLGKLSYLEAQYKQAINFCSEAQVKCIERFNFFFPKLPMSQNLVFGGGGKLLFTTDRIMFQRCFDGDEMFWYETTMLIIGATLKDYTLKGRFRQVHFNVIYIMHITACLL